MMPHIELVALVVREYDPAIRFFVDVLEFELVEDAPSMTTDGRPKRWVVVRPRGGQTGILLARADGEQQAAVVGQQAAGRVGFFLRVDDFDAAYARMQARGVEFVRPPRDEPYGRVAVFRDCEGNCWDLLGTPSLTASGSVVRLTSLAPQLLVDDLTRSIDYYARLGFTVRALWGGFYAIGERDGFELHLKEAPRSAAERQHRREQEHLDATAGVEGIEAFYAECVERGATVLRPLAPTAWGTKDFYLEDPDGNVIAFGGQ